jgi:hypothetical protein
MAEEKDFGNVWEGEADGISPIVGIYFPDAKSVEEVSAVAYGIDKDGNATRNLTAIDQGKLTYDVLTGYFSCLCPFSDCRKWKLYIWRRNSSLSLRNLNWSDGKAIPVSAIISEINQIRQRVKDHTTNIARAIKVPEEGSNDVILPPKEVRAGKVMGFDKDGNPTTGEDCEQVKDLFEAGKAAQESASNAAAQAQEAKRQADIAGTHASDCNDSVAECSELLNEAELEADRAKTYYEKTASVGADAVNKATVVANRAVEAKDAAVVAKDTVLAAKEDVAAKTQELDKAVCYVACAASEVEGRVETAKQELEQKAEQTKQEIAGFTDVYTKDETYSKSQIDGVSTGAEVVVKMNEIIAMLKDYEAATGEKLPFDFWEAVMAEFQRWQMNPNEVKEWVTTSATESTNPYFSTPPTRPVVDFSVKTAKGLLADIPCFNRDTNAIIFLPSATNAAYSLSKGNRFDSLLILPNAVDCRNTLYESDSMKHDVFLPSATVCSAMMVRATTFNGRVVVPNAKECNYMLYGASKFDRSVKLTACSSAQHAFYSTAMSAENISATLDSLPTWKGGTHIITFTGSPGAAELTQDSPSVAAAIAKGWTVEL